MFEFPSHWIFVPWYWVKFKKPLIAKLLLAIVVT